MGASRCRGLPASALSPSTRRSTRRGCASAAATDSQAVGVVVDQRRRHADGGEQGTYCAVTTLVAQSQQVRLEHGYSQLFAPGARGRQRTLMGTSAPCRAVQARPPGVIDGTCRMTFGDLNTQSLRAAVRVTRMDTNGQPAANRGSRPNAGRGPLFYSYDVAVMRATAAWPPRGALRLHPGDDSRFALSPFC